jgi:hypothetical protein
MKKIIILFGICFYLNSYGQINSPFAQSGRLNFAIAEHPAFSILDNKSDNILRPSNTQEIFSFIYADFLSGTTPIIPKNFSLEFSPAQIIGINKITFEDYKKHGNRILYDSKISIGAKSSDDGKELQNFAVGLRLAWIDNSSLAANKEFLDKACKGLANDARKEKQFIDSLIAIGLKYKGKEITDEDVANNDDIKKLVHNLYLDTRFFSIKSLREEYKNKNWNKLKFETAIGVKFSSPDSLVAHSYYSKFEIYNTLAVPFLKNVGQWLIGLNYSDNKMDSIQYTIIDSTKIILDTINYHYSVFSLGTRIYVGTNNFKAFIEGSGKFSTDKTLKFGINIGAEITITDGIWAMINYGNNWIKSTDSNIPERKWASDWYWGFDIRFKIPERMTL